MSMTQGRGDLDLTVSAMRSSALRQRSQSERRNCERPTACLECEADLIDARKEVRGHSQQSCDLSRV